MEKLSRAERRRLKHQKNPDYCNLGTVLLTKITHKKVKKKSKAGVKYFDYVPVYSQFKLEDLN